MYQLHQLPVTSFQLQQLPVTSYQLSVTSYQLPVTSYLLPVPVSIVTSLADYQFSFSLEHPALSRTAYCLPDCIAYSSSQFYQPTDNLSAVSHAPSYFRFTSHFRERASLTLFFQVMLEMFRWMRIRWST